MRHPAGIDEPSTSYRKHRSRGEMGAEDIVFLHGSWRGTQPGIERDPGILGVLYGVILGAGTPRLTAELGHEIVFENSPEALVAGTCAVEICGCILPLLVRVDPVKVGARHKKKFFKLADLPDHR